MPASDSIHSRTSPTMEIAKVGGVWYSDFSFMCVRYCKRVGRFLSARSARSLRTMTMVVPLGPRFFCAPAKMGPIFFASVGRGAMSEDMSATRGALRSAPLVADMSSDIAPRPTDAKKIGPIFAGAQKNLGPSGTTIVIVRKDLAERADKNLPTLLQYRTHIKEKSLYHTPPTFAIYIVGLVLEWIESEGGIPAITKRNDAKAKLLYDTIEDGGFYSCPVERESRSKMNVVFRVAAGDESVEKQFAKEAAAARLVGTPGNPSVGGMRVSLYNAVTLEAVQALTTFMREFHRTRGYTA